MSVKTPETTPAVTYKRDGLIGIIGLNRTPLNAFSIAFLDEILTTLKRAGDDPDTRAIILKSDIDAMFCAGLDLDVLLDQPAKGVRAFLQRLYIDLYDIQYKMPKPTIAVVDGAARGGGMTLAISCDVILASDRASFGYPEINLGVPPAIHFMHLPRIVGRYRAFELLFSARSFDTQEAAQMGLVKRASAADVFTEARELALTFASKPPEAMKLARAAFVRVNDSDYRRGVAVAVEDFVNAATTPEAQEGLRAFLERRKPAWQNDGR